MRTCNTHTRTHTRTHTFTHTRTHTHTHTHTQAVADCELNPVCRHPMASPAATMRVKVVIAKIFVLVNAGAINVSGCGTGVVKAVMVCAGTAYIFWCGTGALCDIVSCAINLCEGAASASYRCSDILSCAINLCEGAASAFCAWARHDNTTIASY